MSNFFRGKFCVDVKTDYEQNELIFLDNFENLLGEEYTLTKTADSKCNVDFIVKKCDVVIGYLELKVRNNISAYNSLMIGRIKLHRINQFYRPAIIVWYCMKSDTLWCRKFSEDLLNYDTDGKTYFIPKDVCLVGIHELLRLCHQDKW